MVTQNEQGEEITLKAKKPFKEYAWGAFSTSFGALNIYFSALRNPFGGRGL